MNLTDIDKKKAGFFNFKRLKDQYLITNDIGDHEFLKPCNFEALVAGRLEKENLDLYLKLQEKGFIRDSLDFENLSKKFSLKNQFMFHGPSLHIMVVTLRCDHNCLYCQSKAQGLGKKEYDMSPETARKTVDIIFESPNPSINIEFQGGEPLTNFETIKFIIEYANEKCRSGGKKVNFLLVSNFSLMNEEKLSFFLKNNVSFCTSFDGPDFLHNKNRLTSGDYSYKKTTRWIKRIQEAIKENATYEYRLNALVTLTKASLRYPKEIIDEYIKLKLPAIHLRPIQPFGIDKKIIKRLDITADEFLKFYRTALDYIIELNLKGKEFSERSAKIILAKILSNRDPNFLDLRSPCGAGIGQIAYNFNGNVYTCDEGRMLSMCDDELFRMGNVFKNTYKDMVNSETVKTMCAASCLDNLITCSGCVYKPYCGVCPVSNYVTENNIFSEVPENKSCRIHKGMLDYLFEKIYEGNSKIIDLFYEWVFPRE